MKTLTVLTNPTPIVMVQEPKKHEDNDLLMKHTLSHIESEQAIERLCQFIQFPTISSIAATDGTYQRCATWLCNELNQINRTNTSKSDDGSRSKLFDSVFLLPEAPIHSPVVIAIWKGSDSSLPILLLNSHYDVVPASDNDWRAAKPFAGQRIQNKIYGRGTQDMKCVCIQYIEAIRKIIQLYPSYQPQRDIYLTFVPDEGNYM
jgi:acetylornithine deacetylase/succinyl-diaminopimelate desuccinylase-like protein